MDESRVMEIDNRKEALDQERKKLLEKYGYERSDDKEVDTERLVNAFHALCDLSINAWPRETAAPQAVADYTRFIDSLIEFSGLSHERREIYMAAQAMGQEGVGNGLY